MKKIASLFGIDWGVVHYNRADVIFAVENNGSRFVAVGTHLVLVSDDGLNWQKGTPPRRTNQFALTYGNGKFVAVGDRNHIATSANGFKWVERRYIPNAGPLWGATFGDGTFMAVGEKGQVLTSPNAITWTERSAGTSERLQAVTYGDGKFIAIGVSGGFYLSTDQGFSWTKQGKASTGLICATFGKNRFAAGGRDGIVYSSDDGSVWTKRDPGVTTFIRGLAYSSSAGFIAVGTREKNGYCMIMTSPDAVKWTKQQSNVTSEFMDVSANNDIIAAVALSFISVSIANPPEKGQLMLASPNGGEVWNEGSSQSIRWASFGPIGNVKLDYSTDNGISWTTIINSTANDGVHKWNVPPQSSSQCLVRVSAVDNICSPDTSNNAFNIKADKNTITLISPNGGEKWSARSSQFIKWTGSVAFSKIDIEYNDGSTWKPVVTGTADDGLYEWTVPEISTTEAKIWIKGYDGGTNPTDYSDEPFTISLPPPEIPGHEKPFGSFDTPGDNTTGVSGSIALTGWALDNTGVEHVKIYYEVDGKLSFLGDAVFVEGARPDIEQAYPDFPNNSRAGWGYMMLTNVFPDGKIILKAIAENNTGNKVELGTKTIFVDNAGAVKPFGSIDTPAQGGHISGSNYRISGWALTPQPNKIPENGTTIIVFIDGQPVGNVNYNHYRKDIGRLFPGYANSNGASGYFDFDTTVYGNGIHTISWNVTDNAGNTDGIGSRYFFIQNSGAGSASKSRDKPPIESSDGQEGFHYKDST